MSALATALISALTSVAVVVVAFFLSSREDRKKAAQAERQELNARYLNPLRLHLAESRFRLAEILLRTAESGQCEDLLTIDAPADLSDREAGWFCALLLTPERRAWLDRLIAYYLETGRGMKLDRVTDAVDAMEALSAFLDDVTGGGESVRSRLAAEGIFSL